MTDAQLRAAAKKYCELREWPGQAQDLKRASDYLWTYFAMSYKHDPDADAALALAGGEGE